MLEDRQNIDDIFSDALYEYQEEVPCYTWTNIREDLNDLRKKKRVIILKRTGVFIAVILTFILGYWAANHDLYERSEALYLKTIHRNIVNKHKYGINQAANIKSDNSKVKPSIKKETDTYEDKNKINNNKPEDKHVFQKAVHVATKPAEKKEDSKYKKRHNQLLTDALLCKEESRQMDGSQLFDDKSVKSNWSFGAKFSPVYSINIFNESTNSTSERSSMYSEKDGIDRISSEVLSAYTGGVNVNYRLSKRFSIESGVFYSTRKQLSKMSGDFSAYKLAKTTSGNIISNKLPSTAAPQSNIYTASYIQDLDYLELPFAIRYKLIDRKLGLDLSGGVSTNFLIKNNISSQTEFNSPPQYANSTLYNAKFSLGVNYRFFKQMQFNLEPTLRYSINPSSNSFLENYPYSFAIFAGFVYNLK